VIVHQPLHLTMVGGRVGHHASQVQGITSLDKAVWAPSNADRGFWDKLRSIINKVCMIRF